MQHLRNAAGCDADASEIYAGLVVFEHAGSNVEQAFDVCFSSDPDVRHGESRIIVFPWR